MGGWVSGPGAAAGDRDGDGDGDGDWIQNRSIDVLMHVRKHNTARRGVHQKVQRGEKGVSRTVTVY